MRKLPIIYGEQYNISLPDLRQFHPFDAEKYRKIYQYLIEHAGLSPEQFYQPEPVSNQTLRKVHSQRYLDALEREGYLAEIIELPVLSHLPINKLRDNILTPMRYAVQGTLFGVDLAQRSGWAVNLSGGYHHAHADHGEGFCFFADIPLAVREFWEVYPQAKVLIVDLDAHQGNGVSRLLGPDPRCAILDVYNGDIYPNDTEAERYVDFAFPLASYTRDEDYLLLVKEGMRRALRHAKPDLIIYNAGTDIYEGDQLGQLSVSAEGVLARDQYIFETAWERHIPILMLPSGGYSPDSGLMIGRSLHRILLTVGVKSLKV